MEKSRLFLNVVNKLPQINFNKKGMLFKKSYLKYGQNPGIVYFLQKTKLKLNGVKKTGIKSGKTN